MITYGSDCSGIEAPYIALSYLLGKDRVRHAFSSDIDHHAREMITENFNVETLLDDASLNREKVYTDIYFAGFPCQPFSISGKREGFEDERGRGTVFFHIYEYIKMHRPTVAVLENVKGLLNHDGGKTFAVVLEMLKSLKDYNVYHDILSPDTHADWPHHRPRVFIVCIKKSAQQRRYEFPEQIPLTKKASSLLNDRGISTTLTDFELNSLNYKIEKYRSKGVDITSDFYFIDVGASADFGSALHEKVPALKASRSKYYITEYNRKLETDEIRKLQGFPKLNVVVSDTQFCKQLGNSVCIPLLLKLFTTIFGSLGIKVPTAEMPY